MSVSELDQNHCAFRWQQSCLKTVLQLDSLLLFICYWPITIWHQWIPILLFHTTYWYLIKLHYISLNYIWYSITCFFFLWLYYTWHNCIGKLCSALDCVVLMDINKRNITEKVIFCIVGSECEISARILLHCNRPLKPTNVFPNAITSTQYHNTEKC